MLSFIRTALLRKPLLIARLNRLDNRIRARKQEQNTGRSMNTSRVSAIPTIQAPPTTYRPPAGLGPFSLSPLYCLRVLLLSDVCVSLWLSLRVLLLSYVCVSLWLSLHVLLLFPHGYCLRVLSPVAASRVLAARRPSAIMCFPWARRLIHDVVWRNCISLAGKL